MSRGDGKSVENGNGPQLDCAARFFLASSRKSRDARENGVSRPVPGDPCPKRRRQPWRRHPLPGQAPARRPPRTVAGGQGHSGGPHETHRRPDNLWSGQRRADVRHRLPAATRRYRLRAELRVSRALQDGAGDRRRPAAGRGRGRFRRGATLRGMWIRTGMPCGAVRRCGCLGMATTDDRDRLCCPVPRGICAIILE